MKARVLSGLAILSLATALTACSDSSESDVSADGNSAERTELNVLAASSTRVFNDELKDKAAESEPPASLLINNARTSALVQQLFGGAPGDVLLSADRKNMTHARDAGVG